MTLSEDAKIKAQDEGTPELTCLADVPEQTEGERATGEIKYRAGYQQGYMAALCDVSDHSVTESYEIPITLSHKVWRVLWRFGLKGRLHKWGRTDQSSTFELPPRLLHPEVD